MFRFYCLYIVMIVVLTSYMILCDATYTSTLHNEHETLMKRAKSNSEDQENNRQGRLDIDLNKPYIAEESDKSSDNEVNQHASTHPAAKNSGPEPSITLPTHVARKAPSEYAQTKEAKRKREEVALLREKGGGSYRAFLDRKNELKRESRKRIKLIGNGTEVSKKNKKVSQSTEKIKQARKNIREGKGTEEDHLIVENRRRIEKQSRDRRPRPRNRTVNLNTLYREKVRLGTASLQEKERVEKWQARDRLYQKKRYDIKKANKDKTFTPN